jgi:phosphoribosylformylglycinamidine (FGAM) synthase PurS component
MAIMNVQFYIKDVLGQDIQLNPLAKNRLVNLPVYIKETYQLLQGQLYQKELVFAQPKDLENISTLQIEKQFALLKKTFPIIVLIVPQIAAYNRKRLIEKGINFIVPGKQLFLPDLLIDLRERDLNENVRRKSPTLLPSAQFMVIYHIIHRDEKWQLGDHPFKAIAEKTGYTAMAITKAIDNLKHEEIVDVTGEKEKFIRFRLNRAELWNDLVKRKLLINPILKKVYVDDKPTEPFMLLAGTSALPEYSDMNPGRQLNYATDRTTFYDLREKQSLTNLNEQEGKFGLEVWKYDPLKLVAGLPNDLAVVDPLSLYLSLKNHTDERIEMALDQIINKYIW